MKRFYFTLLVSIFAFQVFASDLVLIPTKNFDETKSVFSNPSLTVNFYKNEFIIATLDGGLKSDFVVLDNNPWEANFNYYLVYIDETVNKEEYQASVNAIANVLHDGGTYLILRIDETLAGQLTPAKNDGTVRISNKKVMLPKSFSYNTSSRWDPDPFVVGLLNEVSTTNIIATVQHLQDYGTRNAYTPESVQAQNWLKDQFEDLGLSVELQDFTMPSGPASDNVIATQPGTKYPDEYVVLGSHYDSYSYSGLAPGADDNATGTAGIIEIARILSQYEFDRTIIYCNFSGEEYGLYGSEAYADRCAQQGMNIHGYFNMDMVGYLEPGSYIHTDLIYPQSAQELATFYTDVTAVYLPDFTVEVGTLIGGDSDHTSFNNAGFMGLFPFEDGSDYSPYIHTSNDIIGPSVNNEEQAGIFTQAILASVVTMSNRLTPPQNLVGIPGDGEVDLSWDNMLDIDNFNIYKDGDLIASTTDLFYHDEDVMNGTQYEYYITAIYSDTGDESDPSNEVLVTPMPPIGLPLIIDFESGAPYWDFEDTWGVSTSASHSPSHSITESPNGDYGNNLEIYATLNSVNLSGYTEASLSFWTKYALESGYDYMWLEISTNGSNWIELDEFNGNQNSWQQKTYSLNDYLGEPYVVIRFHFYSDVYITEDGMYIDDFEINAEGGGLQLCEPIYTTGCSLGDGFNDFILAEIENTSSGCGDLNGTGWSQYLELGPAHLTQGETYDLVVSSGYTGNFASIWIDFNDDYELTLDERVLDNYWIQLQNTQYTVEITIPTDANPGEHMMRARTNFANFCNDPCIEYGYGEAEDYIVVIEEGSGIIGDEWETFEDYNANDYLVAQANSMGRDYWTTWSNSPGSAEDPMVSSDLAYSGINSAVIEGTNDAVLLLGDMISGIYAVSFRVLIPTGFYGYFNLLQDFSGSSSQWGMQAYFDAGGIGTVDAGGAGAGTFNYSYDTWMFVEVVVDLDEDWAQMNVDGNSVVEWQWSTGSFGTGTLNQLGAMNLYAWNANGTPKAYFDDIDLVEILDSEIFEDFETYNAGEQLVEQAVAMGYDYWTTWSNSPGSAEDPFVTTDVYQSGDNSIVIEGTNDAVLLFGDKTTGAYTVMFSIYIPDGYFGYFNLLQDFAGTTSQWGTQCYFDAGGIGTIDAGAAAAGVFNYNYDEWVHVKVDVDLDQDWADIYVNDEAVVSWQWSTGPFGTGTLNQLSAMNLWAWGDNGTPKAYFDDIMLIEKTTPVGVEEIITAQQLVIYPNPATTLLNIVNDAEITTVRIMNQTGQVVYFDSPSYTQVSINIAEFSAGIYFIEVTSEKGVATEKLIIN
jgi:hypothetical protein